MASERLKRRDLLALSFITKSISKKLLIKILINIGIIQPRSQVLSPTRRETLVGSGHVSPRIWEITNKRLGGGADKCEICLYIA